jgi:hypothetical protein
MGLAPVAPPALGSSREHVGRTELRQLQRRSGGDRVTSLSRQLDRDGGVGRVGQLTSALAARIQ